MKKLKLVTFIFVLLTSALISKSKPLIAPDTVFISPAYYNENSKDLGIYSLFNLKVNNKTGIEIISMASEINLNVENPNDKTTINTLPQFYVNKTGNIVLENGSLIEVKANIYFNNPKTYHYETNMIINYKTIENGFQIDTVHIIANREDSKIFTKNQKLTRDICEAEIEQESFAVYSTLINGTEKGIRVDSINFRSEFNIKIVGYLNKLFDNQNSPKANIDFPYYLNTSYLTAEIHFIDSIKKDNFIYVDYYTDKGVYTDTISIAYTKMKGITAKSWYQNLKSVDYSKVESKPLALRLCSEKGYRIKSINLEGEFDKSEVELNELIKVGEVIDTTFAVLSDFTISPKHIPDIRSGAIVYELENLASGNLITVNFPFSLEIETPTDIAYGNSQKSYVFPNPVSNTINISKDLNIVKIELIDLLGNTILTNNNSYTMNVSGVSKGVYYIRLSSKNNTLVEKIIIE